MKIYEINFDLEDFYFVGVLVDDKDLLYDLDIDGFLGINFLGRIWFDR